MLDDFPNNDIKMGYIIRNISLIIRNFETEKLFLYLLYNQTDFFIEFVDSLLS